MVVEPDRVTANAEPDHAAQDESDPALTVPHQRNGAQHGSAEPVAAPAVPAKPAHRPWPSARQQIGTGVAVLGWGMALFLVGHRFLPDSAGLVSLVESSLPWLAIPTALLLLAALAARSPRAVIAAVAATALWGGNYGPQLLPRGADLPPDLRVLSEDVNASTAELAAAGSLAAAQHADILALQDVYPRLAGSPAITALNDSYGYHVTQYEFGLWSRYPVTGTRAVGLATSTSQTAGGEPLVADAPHVVVGALRVTVATPRGDLVVYLVHLPPPVLGGQGFAKVRNAAVDRLAALIAADPAPRLAVVGSLNVAATDRRFTELTRHLGLTSAQASAGRGFGFTWPAAFPAVRLDDLLARGATPVRCVVLPALAGGKAHLPIEIDLHL